MKQTVKITHMTSMCGNTCIIFAIFSVSQIRIAAILRLIQWKMNKNSNMTLTFFPLNHRNVTV